MKFLSLSVVALLCKIASAVPAGPTDVPSPSNKPPAGDGSLVVTASASGHGNRYEVGRPNYRDEKPTLALKPFDVDVDWVPVADWACDWIATSEYFRLQTAITRYALCKGDYGIYSYKLWITNEENYNYHFYDYNDNYQINTYAKGDHFVRYNSDYPTIIRVTGS